MINGPSGVWASGFLAPGAPLRTPKGVQLDYRNCRPVIRRTSNWNRDWCLGSYTPWAGGPANLSLSQIKSSLHQINSSFHQNKSSKHHLRIIRASSGHHLGIIRASFGHHSGIIWAPFGHHLGIIWASYGYHLGIIWALFGHLLGII